jgi:hypothetical protein
MPPFAYVILAVGTLLWLAPFLVTKRNIVSAQELDRRARWGILLVAVAYSILWQTHFWERSPEGWRIVASVFFFLPPSSFPGLACEPSEDNGVSTPA